MLLDAYLSLELVDATVGPDDHVRCANELGGLPTTPKSGVLYPALGRATGILMP
jgi:hypothetical protein